MEDFVNEPTETEWAYLAGILDGEGTIGLYQRARYDDAYDVLVNISNTDYSLISWMFGKFGGRINQYGDRYESGRRESWKSLYRIVWSSKESVAFILSGVYSYLIVKKRLAEVMLNFVSTPKCETDMRSVAYNDFKSISVAIKNSGRQYAHDTVPQT